MARAVFAALVVGIVLQSPVCAAVVRQETIPDTCSCSPPEWSTPVQQEVVRSWDACPLGVAGFDPVEACTQADAGNLAGTFECKDILVCSGSSSCVNYATALFGTEPSEEQHGFVENMVSLCVQLRKTSLTSNHVQLAAFGVSNANGAKACASEWDSNTTSGVYCVSEMTYRHAVVKAAFALGEEAPARIVSWVMDEMIASATEVTGFYGEKTLCIAQQDAFLLGQVIGDMVETYFSAVSSYSSSSVLHQCCHPVCDQVLQNYKAPSEKSRAGAASVSLEELAYGCCDIARVDVTGCDSLSTPTPTPLPVPGTPSFMAASWTP
mmetsp:Transcript_12964/g.28235  ORF Transcript_12964/g.28235 Transcript_12964/m.28235 type:complete len:323 (-) Transcript_12964:190-1158(-)